MPYKLGNSHDRGERASAAGRRPGWLDLCTSGCPLVQLSGCPAVRLSGCPAVRLSGCSAVRLSGCPLVRLSACPAVRLSSCLAVRLSGCPLVRLSRPQRPGVHDWEQDSRVQSCRERSWWKTRPQPVLKSRLLFDRHPHWSRINTDYLRLGFRKFAREQPDFRILWNPQSSDWPRPSATPS